LEMAVRHLMKSSVCVLDSLRAQAVPALHIICDEARICRRNSLQVVLNVGELVIYAPLQNLPEVSFNMDVTDEVKLVTLTEQQRQPTETAKVRAAGWNTKKGATMTFYGALSNSLRRLVGFTFSLSKSPSPLRPVGRGEIREERNGRHVIVNRITGQDLKGEFF
jgi:hypothetical protein